MNVSHLKLADDPMPVRGYHTATLLMRLLRDYFQADQAKEAPQLQQLVWVAADGPRTADEATCHIEIDRLGTHKPETTDLPKILVRRDPIINRTVGIDGGAKGIGALDRAHEKVFVGTVTLFCCSREFGQSELLGAEVYNLLTHFETQIRKKFCLRKFATGDLGATGILKELPNYFATPVTARYAYADVVQITTRNFPLREVNLEIE